MHSNLSNIDQPIGTTTTSDCSERGSCISSVSSSSSNGSSNSILGDDNEEITNLKLNNKRAHKHVHKNNKKQKHNNLNDDSSNSSTTIDKLAISILSSDLSSSNANFHSSSLNISSNDTVYEITARILLMSIKWCKSLQSFNNLVYRDQVNGLFFKNHYC